MNLNPVRALAHLWSTTRFGDRDLSEYAEGLMVEETRRGVMTMSFVSLLLLVATSILYAILGFGPMYTYTNTLLAVLSFHIFLSARAVGDIRVLHLLGMSLLTISGVAFVLLAHRTGSFSAVLLAAVVLLFMVIPLVPWGLGEASIVVVLVYAVFTLSTWTGTSRFDRQILWTLQFVMLGSGLVTLTVVARGTLVRKDDILARFELEGAQREMELLSLQDPLTGAWNRRYLQSCYPEFLARAKIAPGPLWFVVCDVDDFKQLNDTHGHECGDRVLQGLSEAFQREVGDSGVVVRMGGDEFALLFFEPSPYEVLHRAVESARTQAGTGDSHPGPAVSISAGVVALSSAASLPLDVAYKRADTRLYTAKRRKGATDAPFRLVGPSQDGRELEPWVAVS